MVEERRMNEIAPEPPKPPKPRSVLSFRPIGEPIRIEEVTNAYREMATEYGKPVPPEAMDRVGEKSGSHLLKLITPRADGDQSVMRPSTRLANRRPDLVPSVNAADIPVAKIAFRPVEILGHPTKSLVDHILNPDDISGRVVEGFAEVFGADVLAALKSSLTATPTPIVRLPAAEFPVIFLPNPAGGDLQATPVAPAAAYMAMRDVCEPYFHKQEKDGPKVPRRSWSKQSVSAKPQNISGAIGGPRIRFHATFPRTIGRFEAEIRRFLARGNFPQMPGGDTANWILGYADLLARDAEYSNRDIRAGLDRLADRLISEALNFIDEVRAEAIRINPVATEPPVPPPDVVLFRRRWARQEDSDRARQALTGAHFRSRLQAAEDRQ
jgi:hypothetical protein